MKNLPKKRTVYLSLSGQRLDKLSTYAVKQGLWLYKDLEGKDLSRVILNLIDTALENVETNLDLEQEYLNLVSLENPTEEQKNRIKYLDSVLYTQTQTQTQDQKESE
jgi:hypothetical protein